MSRVATKGPQLLSACRRLTSLRLAEIEAPSQQPVASPCRSLSDAVDSIRRSRPSLDQLPSTSDTGSSSFSVPAKETKISTMENGMKVATENSYGQFVTIGRMSPRYDACLWWDQS